MYGDVLEIASDTIRRVGYTNKFSTLFIDTDDSKIKLSETTLTPTAEFNYI